MGVSALFGQQYKFPLFSNIFSEAIDQLMPNLIWSLLERDMHLSRWSFLHDQDGCHAHI